MSLKVKPQSAGSTETAGSSSELYLLDGHSLTFRAYYGMRGNLTTPDGSPVSCVYGFLRMLLKIWDEHNPKNFAVVFDTGGPTFRDEIYAEYKANREAPPPDFSDQMEMILKLLKSMGVAVYQVPGFEADDVLATMTAEYEREGGRSVVITADKDLFQLVNDQTRLLRVSAFGKDDFKLYDEAAVEERMGVRPDQVADWLALVGDPSDNIPGVPSIGAKGATVLLKEFSSVDNLLDHAEDVKSKRQKNSLVENEEVARLSLRLSRVNREAPIEWSLDECRMPENIWGEECIRELESLGFDSILRERTSAEPGIASVSPSQEEDVDYRAVYDEAELRDWVKLATAAPWVSLDTETTGLNPMTADLVGISLSYQTGEAIYIPVSHRVGVDVDSQLSVEAVRACLAPLLEDGGDEPSLAKLTAHHAKFDWKVLARAGFNPRPPSFDSMLASFVLDPGRPGGHGLKSLSSVICGVRMTALDQIIGKGKNALGVDEIPIEDIYKYAAADADITLRLTESLSAELAQLPGLQKLMSEVEVPLIPILQKMEMGGIAVDAKHLEKLSLEMGKEIVRLGEAVRAEAGLEFNIDSPKQTAKVLFEDLKLPPGKKTKTGYSTDTSVLEGLASAHDIARLILEYRAVKKLKSTYADTLPQQIHRETKRVHTSYNQTVAQTGRLSSDSPNLQNIPVRSELGREIRRSFVPDAPGHLLLSADYSQIELRILAHLSGDEALNDAYREGRDIHALTASRVFGVLEGDVGSDMRAQAKVINFGILYGMSAHGLSQRLRIPRGDAARFIEAYFAGYPGVRKWIDATLEEARENGYVETMLGRRRYLPDIKARNTNLRNNAERIAVNTPIQGTNADMIKLAMIRVDKELEGAAPGARMVLQVHDELIFSTPEVNLEATTEFVVRAMREALPLVVPIVVDTSSGPNWAECEK